MSAGSNVSVGLVLGAGGIHAEAWHAGVLKALHDTTGWDARSAELITGTSAGAVTGLYLRTGISPSDLYAIQCNTPLSFEAQQILDRVKTPYREGKRDRTTGEKFLQSPGMLAHALWPLWRARPLHAAVALLPRGTLTTEAFGQRLAEMHPEPWPSARLWIVAVRLSDGKRVVFGRDDTEATAAEAVRASCAVPARYEPVVLGEQRYVDGGVHSYTNADLMGPPAFDTVIVSSVMSGDPGWSRVGAGLSAGLSSLKSGLGSGFGHRSDGDQSGHEHNSGDGHGSEQSEKPTNWCCDALSKAWSDGRAPRAAKRHWMAEKLREEVEALQRRNINVLVVEPDADAIDFMDGGSVYRDSEKREGAHDNSEDGDEDTDSSTVRARIAAIAEETTRRELSGNNKHFVELLQGATT